MNKVFTRVAFSLICLLLSFSAFSADKELITRYLNAANDSYSAGNNQKAFTYINIVLSSYKEEALPDNVEVISETIYYAYLEQIKETRARTEFNNVKEKLLEFPYLSSERISRMVKIINTYEAQDYAWGADPSQTVPPVAVSNPVPIPVQATPAAAPTNGNSSSVRQNTLELQLALEVIKQQTADQTQDVNTAFQKELLDTQKNAYESALSQAKEVTGTNNRILAFSLIILAAVCFIVFILVLINMFLNLKTAKNQNDKFVETLKAVSQMSRPPSGVLAIEALPQMYGTNGAMRMIGSTALETGLPPGPVTDKEKQQLNDLAQKCKDVGIQIDEATGRKNNSKNVSEMVYKIALEMGLSNYEATLLFTIAMVYDIGFLEIDKKLLQAESLTEDQKFEIRNHVKQGLAQLSFVPEIYMTVFADGVLMHHENVDGSGYPEGISGSRIPYIARLIHVAESFVALISRRNYRDIYDKESAIDELRKKAGLYDQSIVDILERII